jgi:hypothetical protein
VSTAMRLKTVHPYSIQAAPRSVIPVVSHLQKTTRVFFMK